MPIDDNGKVFKQRSSDAFVARWTRILLPLILLILGIVWREVYGTFKLIPSQERMQQIEQILNERPALILETKALELRVTVLEAQLIRDRQYSTEQRAEILSRLQRLEDRLEKWFERASK